MLSAFGGPAWRGLEAFPFLVPLKSGTSMTKREVQTTLISSVYGGDFKLDLAFLKLFLRFFEQDISESMLLPLNHAYILETAMLPDASETGRLCIFCTKQYTGTSFLASRFKLQP
jgi:hypothetical protein